MKVMFKRVGFTYVQKENFQLVKTLGFYFVRFNIVGIILTTLIMLVSFKIAIVIFMISSLLYMFYLYQGMKFTFKIDENKLAYILTSALVITDIIVIFVLPKLMN